MSDTPPSTSVPADRLLAASAILAGLGVALGALAAHALKSRLEPSALVTFETGVRYHTLHAVAAVLMAVLAHAAPAHAQAARRSGWLFLLGIVLFSGSLYGLAFTGLHFFGPITPFGGVAFIAGWLLLGIAVLRRPR